ncbi:hypothetical protein D1007_02494 [Hordeum vulgare]|nr:hypothetical protein D1007_02494 [Hordeum vulgare]
MDLNDGVKLIGSQPPTIQANELDVIASEKVIHKDGGGDADGGLDEVEEGFHGIDVGDLDAYITQKEMDYQAQWPKYHGTHIKPDLVLKVEIKGRRRTKRYGFIRFHDEPPCADQEDMPKKWMAGELDRTKEKDVPAPPCWCGDVCKVKVSIDRKK